MSSSKYNPRNSSLISRREFMKTMGMFGAAGALSVAGGGLLSGCAKKEAELAKASVQFNWIMNVEFAGFFAAEKEGYYKEENLELDFATGGPSISAGPLLDSRQKDLGCMASSVDLIKFIGQGARLACFATMFQRSPAGLMYIKKHPDGKEGVVIDTPEAAKGKRIGIQGGPNLPWRVICKQAGLDIEKDMEVVQVGFDPSPLIDGTVDGYWCFATNQPGVLRAQGYEVGVLDAYEWGYKVPGNFMLTHQDYLKEHKDIVTRFLRGTIKGWAWANSHAEDIARYTVDKYGAELKLDLAQQTDEVKEQVPYMTSSLVEEKGLLWSNMEDWENAVKILKDMGELDVDVDIKQVVTTELLEEVYKAGKSALGQG